MNLPTKKEMRWFVMKLIDIRDSLPNHVADIEFNCNDIIKQKFIFNITTTIGAKTKIEEMLYLIKNDGIFLDSLNNFQESRLSWNFFSDKDIRIVGYQMKLLTEYLKENILKGEKVFSLTVNTKGQQVIEVYGDNTGKRIESQEQFRAFCYFLNNPNRIIPYPEIFEELKRGTLHDSDYYTIKYPTDEKKEEFVQSTVYNLKRKLIKTSEKYGIDIDKVLETISKKGYRYHI